MSRILPKVNVECPEKVEYLFHYSWEDEPVASHFDDKEIVAEILDRIDDDDMFAWFTVSAIAVWGHIESDPPVYLGGCSYKDEADFLASDCAEDLRREARDVLLETMAIHRQLTNHFILREQE